MNSFITEYNFRLKIDDTPMIRYRDNKININYQLQEDFYRINKSNLLSTVNILQSIYSGKLFEQNHLDNKIQATNKLLVLELKKRIKLENGEISKLFKDIKTLLTKIDNEADFRERVMYNFKKLSDSYINKIKLASNFTIEYFSQCMKIDNERNIPIREYNSLNELRLVYWENDFANLLGIENPVKYFFNNDIRIFQETIDKMSININRHALDINTKEHSIGDFLYTESVWKDSLVNNYGVEIIIKDKNSQIYFIATDIGFITEDKIWKLGVIKENGILIKEEIRITTKVANRGMLSCEIITTNKVGIPIIKFDFDPNICTLSDALYSELSEFYFLSEKGASDIVLRNLLNSWGSTLKYKYPELNKILNRKMNKKQRTLFNNLFNSHFKMIPFNASKGIGNYSDKLSDDSYILEALKLTKILMEFLNTLEWLYNRREEILLKCLMPALNMRANQDFNIQKDEEDNEGNSINAKLNKIFGGIKSLWK